MTSIYRSLNLVLLGPPGAGKGTQAKRLSGEFSLSHLSSGAILRAERSAGTELGEQVREYMDSGKLVPDDIIIRVMVSRLGDEEVSKGYILDGFPRTVAQAKALDESLAEIAQQLDAVISLQADASVIVPRLTGRRSCPKCGAIYHLQTMPPKVDEMCDHCNVKLEHRSDDTEEVVKQRLQTYAELTEPLIAYYRQKGVLKEIDGNGTPEEITERMRQVLAELVNK